MLRHFIAMFIVLTSISFSHKIHATEKCIEKVIPSVLERQVENLIYTQIPEKQSFCPDKESMSSPELEKIKKNLQDNFQFDQFGCLDLSTDSTGFSKMFYFEYVKLNGPVNISVIPKPNDHYEIVYSPINTKNTPHFDENPNYWKTAGFTIGTAFIGQQINKQLFAAQADKVLHDKYGRMISIGTTSIAIIATKLIPDSKLSPKWKNFLIGCLGPAAAFAAGVGKEAHDYYINESTGKPIHGVEFGDFAATAIGGGSLAGCAYTVKWN